MLCLNQTTLKMVVGFFRENIHLCDEKLGLTQGRRKVTVSFGIEARLPYVEIT